MLVRKLLYLLVAIILAAYTPCLAADESLMYTGDLFAPYAQTYFCAQASDENGGAPGVPLLFQGTTVWDRTVNTGPVMTNSIGRTCTKANWPADVYEMYAIGQGGAFGGLKSPPVAVTIFNKDWPGIYAGGAIDLDFYGAPPNVVYNSPDVRTATFGFFSRTVEQKPPGIVGTHPIVATVGKPAWLLFLDPFNPLGAVRIEARNFKTELLIRKPTVSEIAVPGGKATVHYYGYCWFQQGSADPIWAYLDGELDVNAMPILTGPADGGVIESDHPYFEIFVSKYPQTWLYGAWGSAYDGGAYLKCTGGHTLP